MAKSAKLSVSIVLPNWNGESLLGKNLPVVIDAAPDAEIIVADDASSDGSVALLKKKFPGVIVVENRVQQGFAGNVNSGVAHATGDIVVLLNTDVRPEMDFLPPLLTSFADPRVFAVGCREKSHDPGGIVERGRGIARWERGFFVHARGEVNKTDTAWVSGGSSAFRRDLWNKFGGMDTIYNPFYWEDIDLSYRALKAGYRIMFEPKSVVGHFH
jgi:GT2 family glycosyltransferase